MHEIVEKKKNEKRVKKNPKQTINFESDIMRVPDLNFLLRPSWSGDFQINANKVYFILKRLDMETLAQNLTFYSL